MTNDYSVTWDDVKARVEAELNRRGASKADKISMGDIEFALNKVWDDICAEIVTAHIMREMVKSPIALMIAEVVCGIAKNIIERYKEHENDGSSIVDNRCL